MATAYSSCTEQSAAVVSLSSAAHLPCFHASKGLFAQPMKKSRKSITCCYAHAPDASTRGAAGTRRSISVLVVSQNRPHAGEVSAAISRKVSRERQRLRCPPRNQGRRPRKIEFQTRGVG